MIKHLTHSEWDMSLRNKQEAVSYLMGSDLSPVRRTLTRASASVFLLALCLLQSEASSDWPTYCPALCRCEANRRSSLSQQLRHTVDCSEEDLHNIPSNLTSGIEALVLAGNHLNLADITWDDHLSNLTELDISSNSLYNLDGFPSGVPALAYLSLHANHLDYVSERAFLSTTRLKHLMLSDNVLEIMSIDAFYGLTELEMLDLSENRISSVDPLWFRGLTSLRELILRDNNIHVLRDKTFTHLVSLHRLDLRGNVINHIYSKAFTGLSTLRELILRRNPLPVVPTDALHALTHLAILDLSGSRIARIRTKDFTQNRLSAIVLSNIPNLVFVERAAFFNLHELKRLSIASNPGLQYIHYNAFVGLSNLTVLHLNDNNLSSVEEQMVSSLPSLTEIAIYNNPLVCDCVARWMYGDRNYHQRNLTFIQPEAIKCLNGQALGSEQILTKVGNFCVPRIIPLFQRNYHTVIGDQVTLDCLAVGVPPPTTRWLLPDHSSPANILADSLLRQETNTPPPTRHGAQTPRVMMSRGVLAISYIQGMDHGNYTCIATNAAGSSSLVAQITVKNMLASLIVMNIARTSITVTWKDIRYGHHYQILYKQSNTNVSYHTVEIKPYMRSYTASNLHTSTSYELCIAVEHQDLPIRINCTFVTTESTSDTTSSVMTSPSVIVLIIVLVVIVLLVICCVTYARRRCRMSQKAEEEIFIDNSSQLFLDGVENMSDMRGATTFENPAAGLFDEDDLEEIRSTASMPFSGNGAHNC